MSTPGSSPGPAASPIPVPAPIPAPIPAQLAAAAPIVALVLALAGPGGVGALSLDLPPGAVLALAETVAPGSHALATAPFADGALPLAPREGMVTRQAWQVPLASPATSHLPDPGPAPASGAPSAPGSGALSGGAPTPDGALALLQPLRAQLEAQGLAILLDCEARACGGFDFRAGIEVLPPPAMFVDLGDFRYLSAEGPGGALSLLVSRSGATGFVQAIEVGPAPRRAVDGRPVGRSPAAGPGAPATAAAPTGALPADARPLAEAPPASTPPSDPAGGPAAAPATAAPATPAALGARLEADGRVVLEGLAFASGSADLAADRAPGGAAALDALAAWLAQDPARRVAVVGHTDATGSLDANLALSRRRAQAVAARLEAAPGVSPAQVVASGAGFLAPRATNLTPEGREANRRVEAVALPPG